MTSIQKMRGIVADGNGHSQPVWIGRLTAPEQALLKAAKTGEVLDCSLAAASAHEQGPIVLEAMQDWGADRIIRAEVLRHLLVASQWPVHAKGVRLQSARITGPFDLESATLRCPLVLKDCYLEQPVILDYATASLLELVHCWIAGLSADLLTVSKTMNLSQSKVAGAAQLMFADIAGQFICRGAQIGGVDKDGDALIADGITVGGGVYLDYKFTTAGAVRLPGARITGRLHCSGAHITGNGAGDAFLAEGATVGSDVLLDKDFTAAGAVRLKGARINGQLRCSGAHITGANKAGNALEADGVTVSGDVYLDDVLMATGAVRLSGASITGLLSFSGTHITGVNKTGKALIANGVAVGGTMYLNQGFTVGGAVRLSGARITGHLNCNDAQITGTNKGGDALIADEVMVSGDVFLGGSFTAAGAVRFSGAQINGRLSLDGSTLADPVAFVADGARIGQQLVWAPKKAVTGDVNLERTQVHSLDDCWGKDGAYWPAMGRLRLKGFVYEGFGGDNDENRATQQQRLDWIRSQHRKPTSTQSGSFDPQPYEQLAHVYRQTGLDSEARQIAIAARSDRRTYGGLGWWRRGGNWLLDKTIKHGYQPLRAVGILLAVYLAAIALSLGAQHQDTVMVPAKDTSSLQPAPSAMVCSADYTCFSPFGYAIDVTIPIIKTGQADSWRPNAAADWGWAYLAGTWVFTGLGWAFTTLAVAGYTGLIRKE